jgi:integrase
MGKRRIKKRSRTKKREVKVDRETMKALEQQKELFREKFGREPGPGDPIFFDPDADTPIPLDEDLIRTDITKAMASAGIDPALIYAFHRTGLIISEENVHLMSPEDLAEWQAALDEYKDRLKGKPS